MTNKILHYDTPLGRFQWDSDTKELLLNRMFIVAKDLNADKVLEAINKYIYDKSIELKLWINNNQLTMTTITS